MEACLVRLETVAGEVERRHAATGSAAMALQKKIVAANIGALVLLGAGWIYSMSLMAKGFGWFK